ncbi:MAG: 16S rRNA (adenine(1518)-N(6)/adenine(1519)-N(6))-dimethyltransferase RsmA [Gammaproteobacteria bacterium]|nr:16S rRNA (adenine(1518)-N(6)/adenine(1519)-N(6))-dimethyltransferase RsmA [Gammaproteobacteria bacterium]
MTIHLAHPLFKHLGQHFLHDQAVIYRIVREINPMPEDRVLEIGPGSGVLTRVLLEHLPHISVVELDARWARKLACADNISVYQQDFLKFNLNQEENSKWRVVGNLPYYISTPILLHLLSQVSWVIDQHLMLQKEVAERVTADSDTTNFGRLSIILQWRYVVSEVLPVPASCFTPPPKVASTFIRMIPKPQTLPLSIDLLATVTRVAFSQRRKLLRHTLGKWLEERKYAGNFDCQRRAQEVSATEYWYLVDELGR